MNITVRLVVDTKNNINKERHFNMSVGSLLFSATFEKMSNNRHSAHRSGQFAMYENCCVSSFRHLGLNIDKCGNSASDHRDEASQVDSWAAKLGGYKYVTPVG